MRTVVLGVVGSFWPEGFKDVRRFNDVRLAVKR